MQASPGVELKVDNALLSQCGRSILARGVPLNFLWVSLSFINYTGKKKKKEEEERVQYRGV